MKTYYKLAAFFAAIALIFCFVSCGSDAELKDKSYVSAVTFDVQETNTAGRYSVTMESETEGAKIYYTTDGSAPATTSTQYSSALTVNANTTVKAFAAKDGMENSPVSLVKVYVNDVEVPRDITTESATVIYHWKQTVEGNDYTLCTYAADGIRFVTDAEHAASEGVTTANPAIAKLEIENEEVDEGTSVSDIAKEIAGFSAVGVISSKLNNGTAVANVYYKRNYVTVTVDANEGTFADDDGDDENDRDTATFRGLFGHAITGLEAIRSPSNNKSLLRYEPELNLSSPTFPAENTNYRAIWSSNTAVDPDTNGVYNVTAANFDSTVSIITSDDTVTIKVTGVISNEQLRAFKASLKRKPNINFELDLSDVEGLTKLQDDTGNGLFNCENLVAVTLPRITTIGDSVFQNCTNFESITIPDSVTSIGNHAFDGCSKLTTITIPNSVTSIGQYAFVDCTELASVTISTKATSIDDYTFAECTKLASITLPESVTSIGNNAFNGCSALSTVNIRGNITSIGSGAFYECKNLETISIPNSVTSIGISAFSGSGLTRIIIPSNVTIINSYTFRDCENLATITIHDKVISIGTSAFEGCSSITNITIPNGVASIEPRAFSGCTGLTSVTIPDSVKKLDSYSFDGCTSLTDIIIPDSVTSIGSHAFNGCISLATVEISNNIASIKSGVFHGCPVADITIPYVGASKGASQAGTKTVFGAIFETASASGLTVADQNYSGNLNISYYIPDTLTDVTVNGGKLFYGAFSGCTTIENITLGEDVMLDSNAEKLFYGCSNLEAIDVDADNTSLLSDDDVLYSKDGTELIAYPAAKTGDSFTIPDTVTKIWKGAFKDSNLTSVTFATTDGWKTGGDSVTVTDPSANATALKGSDVDKVWTRTASN